MVSEPKRGKGNVVRSMFRDIDADCYLIVDGDDTYPSDTENIIDTLSPRLPHRGSGAIAIRLYPNLLTDHANP